MPRPGSARTTTRRPSSTAPPDRSINGRPAWASTISTASWAATPTSGSPISSRTTTQIFPWVGKPGYNLITDEADNAIDHIKQLNAAAPDKPFFVYYVPGATHAPHHPTPGMDRRSSRASSTWAGTRCATQIFANQKKLGVIPQNTQLTPWPDDLPKWDTLDADSKKLFARQAEVFAAYVAYSDNEIGRVIQAVEDLGKLDNTLIIYIEGDNGTSAEGSDARHAERSDHHRGHRHPGGGADEVL